MSYSFSVTAATKAEAKAGVAQKWDEIAVSQPVHEADRAAAQAVAEAFIDVLADPAEGHVINVSAYGSLSYSTTAGTYSASVSVTASLALGHRVEPNEDGELTG